MNSIEKLLMDIQEEKNKILLNINNDYMKNYTRQELQIIETINNYQEEFNEDYDNYMLSLGYV